jgi:hypothetical protein
MKSDEIIPRASQQPPARRAHLMLSHYKIESAFVLFLFTASHSSHSLRPKSTENAQCTYTACVDFQREKEEPCTTTCLSLSIQPENSQRRVCAWALFFPVLGWKMNTPAGFRDVCAFWVNSSDIFAAVAIKYVFVSVCAARI